MFAIVTGFEMVKVNDPDTLFAACAEAGIPFMETTLGMVWMDDGPYLRVEKTRRIRKAKASKAKASKSKRHNGGEDMMKFPVGRPGSRERVEALREWYTSERMAAEDSAFRD